MDAGLKHVTNNASLKVNFSVPCLKLDIVKNNGNNTFNTVTLKSLLITVSFI